MIRTISRYAGIIIICLSFIVLKSSVDYHLNWLSSSSTINRKAKSEKSPPSLLSTSTHPLENFPTHLDSKSLPNFNNGGIIVFYHIYKTGGSTVGKLFHQMYQRDQFKRKQHFNNVSSSSLSPSSPELYFTMIRKNLDWDNDCLVTLDMAKKKKKLIMLELHVEYPAPHFPSLVDLAPTLHKWRKGANERGIDFFAFTLIRKPIPHALSFFNFFHVGHNDFRPPPSAKDHDHWNAFKPLSSSESNFLQSYFVRNRQCRMYDSDPTATLYATKDLVWKRTSKEKEQHHQQNKNDSCRFDMVHNTLFEVLDWVGTTEQMQNLTLPLLTKIVANNPFLGLKNEPFKVFDKGGKKGMKVDDLSENTLTQISERTKLDQILYDDVVQTFTLQNLGWDFKSRG